MGLCSRWGLEITLALALYVVAVGRVGSKHGGIFGLVWKRINVISVSKVWVHVVGFVRVVLRNHGITKEGNSGSDPRRPIPVVYHRCSII